MRMYFIKIGEYGSAFEITIDGKHYLITAAHLMCGSSDPTVLFHLEGKGWPVMRTTFIGTIPGADIAVFEITDPVLAKRNFLPIDLGIEGLSAGRDVYFLGFPYKSFVSSGGLLKQLPMAYVKKGVLSAMDLKDGVLHVDATNNEGFSGGPVFTYGLSRDRDLRIVGVVSSFKIEYESVIDKHGQPIGDMRVAYNTGFMQVSPIERAVHLIRRHTGSKETALVG